MQYSTMFELRKMGEDSDARIDNFAALLGSTPRCKR
jgi:hypothetical protein